MTALAETLPARPGAWARLKGGRALPLATVLGVLLVVWYLASFWLNAPAAVERLNRAGPDWTTQQFFEAVWKLDRPLLPTPDQVAADLWTNTIGRPVTSNRSLVYHAWVTMSSTLVGFVLGTLLGIGLAVGIVHVPTLDRSLMPWVIASQTVPILAIAPMIVVVLGNIGLTGVIPKSIISAYLSFFPVTIGMVKGLRSPDPLQLDLLRTYSAKGAQVFWKLRWPAAVPFLFPSLKIAISLALMGAIVGELPTGAQAGIGARLLAGSYFGQMIQLWSALVMAAILALLCVFAVTLTERAVIASRGGKG
ncbi:ABC transporter permease [Inquilinus limosus]|uniref:ABC transporter permease n=1 Tax=Inquilinus limosus TaxID=171674 RepID=A0A211ZIN7_9PROT|nr:ABC transporter permease [Inquilinus limosus]OWJ65054.1 ABC transporter permease [Inquilinus limosus]